MRCPASCSGAGKPTPAGGPVQSWPIATERVACMPQVKEKAPLVQRGALGPSVSTQPSFCCPARQRSLAVRTPDRERSLAVRTPDPGVVIVSQVSPIPPAAQAATPLLHKGGFGADCIHPTFALSLSAAAQYGRPDTGPGAQSGRPDTGPARRLEKGEENCYTGARETHYNNERRYHSCSSTKSVCWTG